MLHSIIHRAQSFAGPLFLLLFLAGCSERHGDPIVEFADDDAEMNAAIADAKANVDLFVAYLEAHPEDAMCLIKAPLDTGGHVEHIWIDNVRFDGQQFTGRLANAPHDLSRYKQGDVVTVPRADVSDWAFFENDAMQGGYTIRVMEKRMAP
ncbi:MAG: DUF2314 domain-containing protein [Planctomycetaceae bacterium]|nr:DUF2314 domain-containing protein [Planctomycetaceae bacterium]